MDGVNFDLDQVLALSLNEFSAKYIEPAAEHLAMLAWWKANLESPECIAGMISDGR